MLGNDAQVIIDGRLVNADMTPVDTLVRSVMISLFTWRRGLPGDTLPGEPRFGWWGDTYAEQKGSRIGSRLWLLAREKMTKETFARAKDYATESLQWLIDDGVVSAVNVTAERNGIDRLELMIVLTREDGSKLDLRFTDLWSHLHV